MSLKIKIHPSILDIDYGDLNRSLKKLEPFSDGFHVDVMDGQFVDNLTLGPAVVRCIKTKLPLICHLMVNRPHRFLEAFAEAGAQTIIIHAEASENLKRDLRAIQKLGCRAGVSLNPETPDRRLEDVLPIVDLVLFMSVKPGRGGQKFVPQVLPKIAALRLQDPDLDIAVDGGIDPQTAPLALKAGANVLVAGSFILNAKNPRKAAQSLRNSFPKRGTH